MITSDGLITAITLRLEQLKKDIQASMAEAGVNASGRTSSSLQVINYGKGIKLVSVEGDNAPLPSLEVGVIPLKDKAPSNFAGILYDWSQDKGITFADDSERWGFAFALADKIKREGTLRHSAPIDVYSTLVEDCVKDIKDNIKGYITNKNHQI